MGYTKTQRARIEAGLCFRCGAAREGEGRTNVFCPTCAEKSRAACRAYKAKHPEKRHYPGDGERSRAWKAKRRAERLAAGVCVLCGRPRVGREANATQCGICTRKKRVEGKARLQRTRNREAGLPDAGSNGRNAQIWTMGRAAQSLGSGAHKFTCRLDRASVIALVLLRKRYREEERAAGRVPKTHQTSRIVRDCVRRWKNGPCPARKQKLLYDVTLSVWFDAEAWAILRGQAERAKRSKAQTLRIMLTESTAPRRVVVARKNGWTLAGYRERWRRDSGTGDEATCSTAQSSEMGTFW